MKFINYRLWSETTNEYLKNNVRWLHIEEDDIIRTLEVAKELELELSTGLKDKNRKEIFEGDIVEFPIYECGYEIYKQGELKKFEITSKNDKAENLGLVRSAVEYNKALARFEVKPNYSHLPVYNNFAEHYSLGQIFELKVVGNIHENANLLK